MKINSIFDFTLFNIAIYLIWMLPKQSLLMGVLWVNKLQKKLSFIQKKLARYKNIAYLYSIKKG